jgi:hypothetical protein
MIEFILFVVLNVGTAGEREANVASFINMKACNIAAYQLNQHPHNHKMKTLFYCGKVASV